MLEILPPSFLTHNPHAPPPSTATLALSPRRPDLAPLAFGFQVDLAKIGRLKSRRRETGAYIPLAVSWPTVLSSVPSTAHSVGVALPFFAFSGKGLVMTPHNGYSLGYHHLLLIPLSPLLIVKKTL